MAITSLISTLTFAHNGLPDEFTANWDVATNTLTLGGFRQAAGTLSFVDVTYSTIDAPLLLITGRIYVTFYMDSNDIKDAILTYLSTAISGLSWEVISETPARAQVEWDMALTWANFTQDTGIELTSTADGTCTLQVAPVEVQAVPLASMNGIASARGRLLAWDRENAIYRSALLDSFDFTPSLSTQASVGKAEAVRGNIVHIAGISDGYIVYATDNIVRANYTGDEYVFRYTELRELGIESPLQMYAGQNVHALLSAGSLYLLDVTKNSFDSVSPLLDNYLQQQTWPIRVLLLEDRYLCLCLPELSMLDREARRRRQLPIPASLYVPNLVEAKVIRNDGVMAIPYQVYDRVLVLDSKLRKWGSCDMGVKHLFNLTFLNASGLRLDKAVTNVAGIGASGYTQGIGIVTGSGDVCLAGAGNAESWLAFGHTKAMARGYTSVIEVKLDSRPGAYAFKLEPFTYAGELDTAGIYLAENLAGPYEMLYPDITANYFDGIILGAFDIKGLELTLLTNGLV